jgi:hypothetical protein
MQHVNGIIELRHIQHSECSCGIAYPNFPHASANRIHGLPVVGLAPVLDLIKLMPCLTPSRLWERPQIVECAASNRGPRSFIGDFSRLSAQSGQNRSRFNSARRRA